MKTKRRHEYLLQSRNKHTHAERMARLLFDNSPTPCFLWQFSVDHFKLIECNAASLQYLQPFDQITGKSAEELFGDGNKIINELYQCLVSKATASINLIEVRFLHSDNQLFDLNFSCIGKNQVLMIARDLTSIERIRHRLVNSQKNFDLLFQKIQSAILLIEPENHIISEVNVKATEVFGYDYNEMIGQNLSIICRNHEKMASLLHHVNVDGSIARHETIHFRKDGEALYFETTAEKMVLENRLLILYMCIDITHRKKTEIKLRDNQWLLNKSQKIAKIGSYILDFTTGKWQASYVLCEIFNLPPKGNYTYSEFLNVVYHEDVEMIDGYFKRTVLEEKKRFDKEYRIKGRSGDIIWVHGIGELEFDNNGELSRMIGTIQNVTEKKILISKITEARDKALETELLKSAFLHNLSHEIRTPLNAILGFSELICVEDTDYDDLERFKNYMKRSSRQLLKIVNEVIDLSKFESNLQVINRSVFSPDRLIDELDDNFRDEALDKNLDFSVDKNNSIPPLLIESDYDKIVLLMGKLIENAIKFTSKGSVRIGYTVYDSGVSFFVEDTGPGIAPDQMDLVFKPFVQGNNQLTKTIGGLGIGLTLVKRISELLNIALHINSVPASGTIFQIKVKAIPQANEKS